MVDSVIVLNVDISLDTESDMDTLSLILLNVFINLLTESDTETDSDNDLTAPSILDTESLTDMVVSVIDLKLDNILDMESDMALLYFSMNQVSLTHCHSQIRIHPL